MSTRIVHAGTTGFRAGWRPLLLVVSIVATHPALGCSDDDSSSRTSGRISTAGDGGGGEGGASGMTSGGEGGTSGATSGGEGGSQSQATGGSSSGSGGASPTQGDAGAGSGGAGASASGSGGSGMAGKSGSGGAGGKPVTPTAGDAAVEHEDAGIPDDGGGGGGLDSCMPLESPLDVSGLPKCSPEVCPAQDSVCLPRSVLEGLELAASTIDRLADCSAEEKCVPMNLASQAGQVKLPTCVSVNGAEGRCLSRCVPQVAAQASLLPQDICTGSDLCAPCFDPRTSEPTGACALNCDPGPTQPPKPFAHCCSDRGLCVPPSLAGSQAPNLVRETCAADAVCAPVELTDPTFKPKSCSSIDGGEGRCVSTCIGGSVAEQRDRLPTAGCGEAEVCAPCVDPITGEDTGACSINGDKPSQPPYTFERCCDNGQGTAVGVCVTPDLAGDQADMLQQDTCARGRLCAPIKKAIDPTYEFPSCLGLGAGACVPSCILSPLEAALLSRARCDTGEVCAPCATLGIIPTGACE